MSQRGVRLKGTTRLHVNPWGTRRVFNPLPQSSLCDQSDPIQASTLRNIDHFGDSFEV
jgi:hypothetical protein